MSLTDEIPVSVVMPVHNAGHYLRHAVNSILTQQHSNLELIIVDDHCSDGCIEDLSELGNDHRVRVLSAPQRGIISALNHGVSQARYNMIARMDGDDIAMPNRLQEQLNYALKHPNIDIIGAGVHLFKDDPHNSQAEHAKPVDQGYAHYQRWINQLQTHDDIKREFFIESAIPHPTAMFSKQVFEELNGYQDHGWPEDYDLWCRALLAGKQFGKPPQSPLLYWRDHVTRASRQDSRYQKQAFLKCKAHYLAQYFHQYGIQHCTIWGTGPTGLKLHDYLLKNEVSVTEFYDINQKHKNQSKRNKPVHVIDAKTSILPDMAANEICIVAVSARGARQKLESYFIKIGWKSGIDYIFAA